MKYQVIARRYRPRSFDEVVGQESLGTTLRNAIVQNRLAHAYLFSGPRGVGKTSMARIFAKALNCPRAADRSRPEEEWALPCDECDACRAIHGGDDIDVLEMDGASYRGIEDIRDIVENVKFVPSRSQYKIFIIDEVHMLTREAFNALLKTLEEPPAHVKFVFATTESHKIPDTVLSRCQRFDFRPIGEADIARRLGQICQAEGVEAEPGLLEKIARYGKGGLRDAQTLLDQAITFSQGQKLLGSDLERITGRLPEESIDVLVQAIADRAPAAALRAVEACFAAGADPATLLEQVIERLHQGLLEIVGSPAGAEGASSKPPASTGAGAATGGAGAGAGAPNHAEIDLSLGRLHVLNETAAKLRGSPHPRLAVELALVKLARMEDPRALDEALSYLKALEGRLPAGEPAGLAAPGPAAHGPAPTSRASEARATEARARPAAPEPPRAAVPASPPPSTAASTAAPPPAPAARAASAPPPPAAAPASGAAQPSGGGPAAGAVRAAAPAGDFERLRSLWDQILIETRERHPQIAALLGKGRLKEGRDGGAFVVAVEAEFHLKQLREPRRAREFEALVAEITGAAWRMALELVPPGEAAAAGAGVPGGAGGARAGRPSARAVEGTRAGEGGDPREDPLIKKSVDLFKGRIV